ncbi:unnamed protein product [Schistosoma guineensis]|nr:unnamed protein product [Schistosoma guineensis]
MVTESSIQSSHSKVSHNEEKISLNHSHPVVNGSFNKFTGTQSFTPEFPFNYFDTEVKRFDFYSTGIISVFKEIYFGLIMGHRSLDYNAEYEVLNSKELLAAKWSVRSEEKDGTLACRWSLNTSGPIVQNTIRVRHATTRQH